MRVPLVGIGLIALLAPGFAAQPPQRPPSILIESLTGRDSFERYCASCHGTTGRGDGPVGGALRSRPADLTTLARRNEGGFPSDVVRGYITGVGRTVAAHGTTEMPVWGPLFRAFESDARTRLRIEKLVSYIESIQLPSTGAKDLGRQLFSRHCATCHGSTGRGNGPMADQLRRPPPDLTKYTARNGGVFPRERVFRIVDGQHVPAHGDRDMPVWGDVFKQTGPGSPGDATLRIDAIVRYLEGIQERAARLTREREGVTALF
jgi:mono/diheme cytochrome c family protein